MSYPPAKPAGVVSDDGIHNQELTATIQKAATVTIGKVTHLQIPVRQDDESVVKDS
jgi:hypothetical protein